MYISVYTQRKITRGHLLASPTAFLSPLCSSLTCSVTSLAGRYLTGASFVMNLNEWFF